MLLLILVLTLSAIVSFFIWASIHELAHYIAVKHFRKDAQGKFKLYPHTLNDRFVFASVEWKFNGQQLNNEERGWVYIAPRIPSLIGIVITFLLSLALSPGLLAYSLLILFGGSVLDMIVNSLGVSESSDLRIVSRAWDVDPTLLRTAGLVIAILPLLIIIPMILL